MSIATQIEALTENVAALSDARDDIITSINSKGVSATGHGYEDFAYDISQIDQSGSHSPVIAVADTGVISASCGGVTNTHTLSSSDDADFVAGNIKNGVTVFGVTGTHQGAGTYQSKTVTPNAAGQTVYPGSGYDALSSVVINGDADLVAGNVKKDINIFGVTGTFEGGTLEAKSVTPSASQQVVTPSSGNYGLSSVTVAGDTDLVAGNVKKNVNIFGVTGTFEGGTLEAKSVTPSTAQQVITPSAGNYGLSSVTVAGDADLIGSNIRKDVNIFGVTGTYEADSTKDMYVQTDTGVQTGDLLVYSDQLVPANIKKDIVIFGVTGTFEGSTTGSLIVCSCSSNVNTVTATYGEFTVNCYKSGNTAYVNIPYTYTGNVVLSGYDNSSVLISQYVVVLGDINKYESMLVTSKVIYNAGVWNVSGPVEKRNMHFESTSIRLNNVSNVSESGGFFIPPIATLGYQTLRFTVEFSGTPYHSTVGYYRTDKTEAPSIYDPDVYTNVSSSGTYDVGIANGDSIIYIGGSNWAGPSVGGCNMTINKIEFV